MTLINKIVQNVEHKVLNAGNSVSSKVEQHAAEKTENILLKTPQADVFQPIKYKKAKSMEEAVEYAKKILKIKNFDVEFLDIANQVNLSITRALNRTRGKITVPDNVFFAKVTASKGIKVPLCDMFMYYDIKKNKYASRTLVLNKNNYDVLDNAIAAFINKYNNNGQITKDSKNFDRINIFCKYKYEDTLNRYYRLFQQGKLTLKAKQDFTSLLFQAQERENRLVYEIFCDNDLRLKYGAKAGIPGDLNSISIADFQEGIRPYLLKLKTKYHTAFEPNIQTKTAIGFESAIFHELGHNWHSRQITPPESTNFTNPASISNEDLKAATKVSDYAETNAEECLAEIIKGLLSGDKYSDDIIEFGNKITNGKLSSLFG